MNFLEAIKQMQEGKKCIYEGRTYFIENNRLYRDNKMPIFNISLKINDLHSWGIYNEQNKTLSDRVYFGKDCSSHFMYFDKDDVKDAVKEFIKFSKTKLYVDSELIEKAKEIFGEELLGDEE